MRQPPENERTGICVSAAENPPAKASPERPVRSVFEDRK
jgi:hypothetical protein